MSRFEDSQVERMARIEGELGAMRVTLDWILRELTFVESRLVDVTTAMGFAPMLKERHYGKELDQGRD